MIMNTLSTAFLLLGVLYKGVGVTAKACCGAGVLQGRDGYGRDDGYCSCLLYVNDTLVFSRVDDSQRYWCDRDGLKICSRYCDDLFNDEDFRTTSRQESCDALGRDVNTPWYGRNQVCIQPYEEYPLSINLCCVSGQTSYDCNSS